MYVHEIHSDIPEDWKDLLEECRAEVLGMRDYQHGRVSTYTVAKCRGPLCRWAQRVSARKRSSKNIAWPYFSKMDKYNEFFQRYAEFAQLYTKPRPRRKAEGPRLVRRAHLIPASTAQRLHKSRARLAS
jgi:hypothetical protein